MIHDQAPEPRQMEHGSWFWIDKAIIRDYAPKIGAIGVAVYNCLASFVNTQQTCYPSQDRMAEMLGCSRTTVNRAIGKLETCGLIAVERRGRYPQLYRLLTLRCNPEQVMMPTTCAFDVAPVHTNNNKTTRISNNNTSGAAEDVHSGRPRICEGIEPAVGTEPLAFDIARALNDQNNLRSYMFYARTYPEPLLRQALGEAQKTPDAQIRKSRAALFKHLVRIYAQQSTYNPGDQPRN